MISYGGLQLSDNLRLLGLRVAQIKANVQVSEGGVSHILTGELIGGRTLELDGDYTSFQVEAMLAMCDGQARELIHPRGTFSAIIIGTDLADWIEYVEPDPDDIEYGKFQFLEV